MSKPILYIDMDGVVVDFDHGIRQIYPHFSPALPEDDRQAMVDDVCEVQNRNIFRELPPITGAIESVKSLELYFEIYFLSTPMWTVPESFTAKRLWIEEHFGVFGTKRLILSHRKDLNIGDYLVDDRIHNGAGKFTGKHIHFGQAEFPNWNVVTKFLLDQCKKVT